MTQRIQSLMDAAYTAWQAEQSKSYDDFIFDLDGTHKAAVLIGNLNYQVENGGFTQWMDNGYGDHAADVARVLARIGTPTARRVDEMVQTVKATWARYEADRRRWADDNDDNYPDFDALDTEYYSINAQLLIDTEAYLQGLLQPA